MFVHNEVENSWLDAYKLWSAVCKSIQYVTFQFHCQQVTLKWYCVTSQWWYAEFQWWYVSPEWWHATFEWCYAALGLSSATIWLPHVRISLPYVSLSLSYVSFSLSHATISLPYATIGLWPVQLWWVTSRECIVTLILWTLNFPDFEPSLWLVLISPSSTLWFIMAMNSPLEWSRSFWRQTPAAILECRFC